MASTYTGLGTQLMATGENAGTWGTKTNTNLNIIEQIAGGYIEVAVTSTPTTLSVSDGSTGAALAHRCITFTGEISENTVVTIPLDVQTFYIIKNSVSGGSSASYTVQFKYVSGSGSSVTWAAGDTGTKIVYATADDATNPNIVDATSAFVTATSTTTLTNKTLTSPKIGTSILDTNGNELALLTATGSAVNEFTIANAATGGGPTISSTGGDSNIDINVTPKGTGDVVLAGDTVKVGDSGAAATLTSNGAGTLTVTTGGATDLVLSTNSGSSSGTITITDAANGNIAIAPNGSGAVVLDGLSWPTADGTADYVLKTDGSAALSWTEMSGGTSWQSVVTGTTQTAVAGNGYFIDTSSNVCNVTLPSGSLGDEVSLIDYAATFDSNNLTVTPASGEKIQGQSADTTLTCAVERAGFTLAYSGATQGWLLKDK
jgi:hypothetical protein